MSTPENSVEQLAQSKEASSEQIEHVTTIASRDIIKDLNDPQHPAGAELLLPDYLAKLMLEAILVPENMTTYTPEEIIKKYYNGQVEIQCVDGRSIQRNDKLVIHAAGGEIALYGQMLKALDELEKDHHHVVNIWRAFLNTNLGAQSRKAGIYAHSDTHDETHHKEYVYGEGTDVSKFACGCGHCNLIMQNDAYGYTPEQKELLKNLYPHNPDRLPGEHLEKAIVIQQQNSDGTLSSTKNNALGDKQVFTYDVEAVKVLIKKLSEEVAQIAHEHGIHLTPAQIEEKWNAVHDHDTTETVQKQLKFSIPLVEAGEIYKAHIENGKVLYSK